MSLRLRLLLSLLAVLLLMTVPALYAANRVAMLRDVVLELRGQAAQSALAVGRLEAALANVDRYQRVFVAAPDRESIGLLQGALAEADAALRTLRAAGYAAAVTRTGIRPERLKLAADRLEALVRQGQLEQATTYLIEEATPPLEAARAALPALAAAIDLNASASVPMAQRSAVAAGTAATVAVLIGIVLAIALALAAARLLTVPLERLRAAMARVADGTFETPFELPYERADEVGDLSRSFRTMTLRLAELDRLKASFVGTVSHDLKTPVSVIAGYAELLEEELRPTLDARQTELLHALAEQTRTLQRRVDQLLEISHLETGRLRLALEEVDVRYFATELSRELEPARRQRRIRLDVSVAADTPRHLVADPDVLRVDIIGNLVAHALESTPAGGSVRVAFRRAGEHLEVEIADTGAGIPRHRLERLFERYYQSGGAPGAPDLGLAIARAGTEHHGGRIEAESRVGGGTCFRVLLPTLGPALRSPAGPQVATAAHP